MRGPAPREPAARFWNLVNGPWHDPRRGPADCWEWMGGTGGSRRPKGLAPGKPWKRYGRFWLNSEAGLVSAHRAALLLTVGPAADPRHVAGHLCDVPLCCNPSHLVWESQRANVREALERGRLRLELGPRGVQFATTGMAGP